MERCVLCLRADPPMTREHVFAHWLVRQVHGGRLVASDASSVRIGGVVARVCAECNAGWMRTLEVSFRQLLFARPRIGVIHAADRIILARWFTKTAMLLAHARDGVILGAAHRAGLVIGVPEDVEVFLARRRRPPQRLDFTFDVTSGAEADAIRSVAILVDDLVGRVATRGTLASRHGTQLWPLRTHALRWETLPVVTAIDGR